jgi:class 3 adenylate cyclase
MTSDWNVFNLIKHRGAYETTELDDVSHDNIDINRERSSLSAIRPIDQSELDTEFFKPRTMSDHSSLTEDTFKYDVLKNVCVCMVDIVGFSTWCSNQFPHIIARSMVEYNDWICRLIRRYNGIQKIELVGDCCMIVGGMDCIDFESLNKSYLNMIRLSMDMINDIDCLKNVFKSKTIGIRIGIHVADVIGIYLTDPYKYQMFGNDINVCSRLESSAISNTIHVSETTLMCIQDICNHSYGPSSRCVRGKAINQTYKGIGFKTSYQLFLKKNKCYLINCSPIFCKVITKKIGKYEYVYEMDESVILNECTSFKYNALIVNMSPNNRCLPDLNTQKIVDAIISHPYFSQVVVAVADQFYYEIIKNNHMYDFDHFLNFDSEQFYENLEAVLFDINVSSNASTRRSLDLTLVDDARYR